MNEPTSTKECIYFTNRILDSGKIKAWVFKEKCPKCEKALMGKPVVKGKVKIRAKEYICPECGYTVDKDEYEPTLTIDIKYTCPFCSNEGEISLPFVRKKIIRLNKETGKKKSIESIRFQCQKCEKDIDITKKMK